VGGFCCCGSWSLGDYPIGQVALWSNIHCKVTGFDVLANDGSGSCLGSISNRNRCDEDVVRAGANVRADGARVLFDAIVIRKNGSSANV
jgi:hypothetical protein